MIERVLKAKHWQIFILTVGILVVYQGILLVSLFSKILKEPNLNPESIVNNFKSFPVSLILFSFIHYIWFWSVAIGLQNKIPDNLKVNLKKFKLFFFIPIIYIIILSFLISRGFNELISGNLKENIRLIGIYAAIIIPFHFFSIFCIIYTIYCVSKIFKTALLQRETNFSDFIGEFFLIWFFPVGIWVIQPQINKLVKQ